MVLRKKRVFRKRRVVRRRRQFARKRRIPRNRSQIYNFKQHVELTNVSVTAGTTAFFVYTFAFSNISNNQGAFNALYDNYRILAVKVTFYPQFNTIIPTTSTTMTEIYLVFDPDSNTAPTNVTELNAYPRLKRRYFNKPCSIYCKPFPAFSSTAIVGATGTSTTGLVPRKTWLNMAQTDISYHAVLGCITSSQTSQINAQLVRVSATYYFQVKNVV